MTHHHRPGNEAPPDRPDKPDRPDRPDEPDRPNEPDRGDPRPFLLLPYDDLLDDGTRPLPPSVVSWLAPALQISVDGIPYTGGKLPRDRATQVAVKVANRGDKDARALISLYWAVPTPTFSGASLMPDGVSGPVWVDVPRRSSVAPGLALAGPFLFTPPEKLTHVCLLAQITAGDAGAPGVLDPVMNRHYAQHNVDIETVPAGKTASLVFQVNNPFHVPARALIRLRAADEAALPSLQRLYRAQAVPLRQDAFAVQQLADAEGNQQRRELVMELGESERRLCQGLVSSEGLQRGQFGAGQVEVLISPLQQDAREPERLGTLGVIVFAS